VDGEHDVSVSSLPGDDGSDGSNVAKEDLCSFDRAVEEERNDGGEELSPGFGARDFGVDERPVEVDRLNFLDGLVDEKVVDLFRAVAFNLLTEDVDG